MKYRIEVEKIYEGPRPWEWRIFIGDEIEPSVCGSKPTAQQAFDEAVITLSPQG